MSATLLDIYNAIYSSSGELFARFTAATLKLAGGVLAEDPGTPNHANRVAWAQYVLIEDNAKVKGSELCKLSFAQNGDLQQQGNTAEDSFIEWLCATYLNTVAVGE